MFQFWGVCKTWEVREKSLEFLGLIITCKNVKEVVCGITDSELNYKVPYSLINEGEVSAYLWIIVRI